MAFDLPFEQALKNQSTPTFTAIRWHVARATMRMDATLRLVRHGVVMFVYSLLALSALTCGGNVSNVPCEGTVSPFDAPLNPPIPIRFGTVITYSCQNQDALYPPQIDGSWTQINILFTEDANACPSSYLPESNPFTELVPQDVRMLWLAFQVPTGSAVVGMYETCGANCKTQACHCASDDTTPDVVGGGGPFIVSASIAKGSVLENGFASAHYASGTIAVSKFVPGNEIAGTLDATFLDGTHVVSAFDLPFCASTCY